MRNVLVLGLRFFIFPVMLRLSSTSLFLKVISEKTFFFSVKKVNLLKQHLPVIDILCLEEKYRGHPLS